MIKNTEHCVLCEHKKQDFTTGAYCGLTNEKPTFTNKCESKEFGDTLKKKIIEVNTKLKLIEKSTSKVFFHTGVYLFFGIVTLFFSWFYYFYMLKVGYTSTITWLAFYAGLGMFAFAFRPYYLKSRSTRLALGSKTRLDSILKIYNYSYDIAIEIIDAAHGTVETKADVEIFQN